MDWKIHRAILIAVIWIAEVLSAGVTLLAFHVINNAFFKMLKDH